jgi:hypothetical protein
MTGKLIPRFSGSTFGPRPHAEARFDEIQQSGASARSDDGLKLQLSPDELG